MRTATIAAFALLAALGAGAGEVVDDLGVELVFEKPPQRIVSLAPSNTELLFALGLGDRLVGVTEYCNFPPQAAAIERVAGYNSLSAEKVLAARPDLVLAARGNDMEGLRTLQQMGLKVFSLDVQGIEGLLGSVRRVGEVVGAGPLAGPLADSLGARVARVEKAVAGILERPRVMWGYWSDPVFTAGKGTMIDDVFRRAGGLNVGARAEGAWPQVGLETIVDWGPQVIVTTYLPSGKGSLKSEIERLRLTDGWKEVPAVREGRLCYVEADWLLRAGPRLVDALEEVARCLHPERFAAP